MNKIFFRLLHNRSLRLHGFDPFFNQRPDNPVLPLPVISSFTANPGTITSAADSISQLRWTVSGFTNLTINQGVGSVTGLFGVNVKPAATTIYTLTATNASSSVSRSVIVGVGAATDPVVADATASTLSPAAGQVVEFSGSATGGTGGYSYAWSFSDGLGAAASRTTSRSFSAAGTYSATLTVTSNGVSASKVLELSVSSPNSAPVVSISHTPASPVVGDEVTYIATVSQGTQPYSYNWTFGDGSSGGTTYFARKTYTSTGDKTLSLTVTGGATTTATYRISVGLGTPTPDPDLSFLEADPLFDPATGYSDQLTRNMIQGFIEVMGGGGTLHPNMVANSVMSNSRPTHVDLYKLRTPKILVNIVRGVLSHKPDPRFVALLLPFVKKVLDNLVTGWVTYPYDDTPGKVDGNGIIIDRHAADRGEVRWNGFTDSRDNRNGTGRGDKDGYKRWVAWGRSTSRESPTYRSEKTSDEKPGRKKILYLLASADASGIAKYGTHKHALDNMMAHVTLGWACYILDVNGSQNAEWQTYGQLGYDYIFNHWLPLTEETLAARRGAPSGSDVGKPAEDSEGILNLRTALTHNVAAHASIYALMIKWREFRKETVNPKDVKALKLMMRFQIDQFHPYNMPAGLYPDSSSDQFANWAHHCEPYRQAVDLGDGEEMGQAVMTYDREFGGELYNLYRGGYKDDQGRVLTKALFARMARTMGFIVFYKQPGSTFSRLTALGVAGGGTGDNARRAYFNNGDKKLADGSWNGSTVAVRYGKSGGATYSSGGTLHRDGFLGGWYMWADDTPELKATRNWMRRAKHCNDAEYAILPDHFLNTAAPSKRNSWHFLGAYILMKLENPSRTITGLDLSF